METAPQSTSCSLSTAIEQATLVQMTISISYNSLQASTQTAVAYYASRLLSAAFLALERNRKGKLDIHLRFQDGSRKEKVSALYERIRPRITIAYEVRFPLDLGHVIKTNV